ncbi:VanZ like protein [Planomicrobium soli]|uniref:VanZ like protein n=1 Tax=Planomicrobium soli TaxID=1176648 RepID=A0A2P8GQG0_9BACL|nr:VanZ family protein [Planomicrobium soli]PSL36185.1 VanZ like protein [Planomicrobium soli]
MEKTIKAYIERITSELECSSKDKQELAEELTDHLQLLVQEYKEKGFDQEKAISWAIREFGEAETIKEGLQASILPKKNFFHKAGWLFFGIYSAVVLWQLLIFRLIDRIVNRDSFNSYFRIYNEEGFFSAETWSLNSNIVPFKNTYLYITESQNFNLDIVLHNILGNIVVFVPLGIFLVMLFKRFHSASKVAMLGFIITVSIELAQFFLRVGQFDVDDIILNTIGAILGYYVFKSFTKTWRLLPSSKSQDTIN